MTADECQIWWAPAPDAVPVGAESPLLALLDDAERARSRRLRHEPDRAGYVRAHALARVVSGRLTGTGPRDVRFTPTCRHCAGPHGRPVVEDPGGRLHLSISHCGGVAVVAVARTPIGVDVEHVALRGAGPPANALSETEQRVLAALPEHERTAAFIRYWTRKEAILKATGDGLLVSPARLTVSGPGEPPELLRWPDRPPPSTELFLSDLEAPDGHLAALAALHRPLRPVILDGAAPLATAAGHPR